jgi:pimeloyl-ACP methyl ester carboxylesterase
MSAPGPESLDGTRLHFQTQGERGPRVLLLHPVGFELHTWDDVATVLAEQCQVAMVDLPGHGKSDKPPTADYGVRSLGRRVIDFLDELGWEDAILIGNSLGGGTALAAAVQAPERVRGLALVNSVGFRGGLPPVALFTFFPGIALLGRVLPSPLVRFGLELTRGRRGTVSQHRCGQAHTYLRDPAGRAAFFRTVRQLYGPDLVELARHYREIHCPTVVLHGVRDPLLFRPHARRLAASIPGAELRWLARCGHFPQEEAPEELAGELLRFIEKVETGAQGESRERG